MISIIFVNWNSGEQLSNSVRSILDNNINLALEIIVVDNFSSDNSIKMLHVLGLNDSFLKFIKNESNKGFGFACNQGAKLASGDYLLFLNTDTLLSEESLKIPFQFLNDKNNADVGIVGVQMVDENKNISRSCTRFPTFLMFFTNILGLNRLSMFKKFDYHMLNWSHSEVKVVDHVIGAFFFVRRRLFDSLLGFDERFFVYLEDLDFSLRARNAGWRTMFLANTFIFHQGGGSSDQVKANRLFYSLRSKILYGFKHFSKLEAWLLFFLILTLEPIARICLTILKFSFEDLVNTLRGYWMLYCDIYNILNVSQAKRNF
jgi:GT2 family glycosyltransferase